MYSVLPLAEIYVIMLRLGKGEAKKVVSLCSSTCSKTAARYRNVSWKASSRIGMSDVLHKLHMYFIVSFMATVCREKQEP